MNKSFEVFSPAVLFGVVMVSNVDAAENSVTITASPFHLIASIVEVNAEYKVRNNVGMAIILGAGENGSIVPTAPENNYFVREYGVQLNY